MKKWKIDKTIMVLVSSIVLMLMLFYFACQYTLAWLYKNGNATSTGTTNSAKTEVKSSSSTTEFTTGSNGTPKSVASNNLITNNGTTDVLLRVFYSIYVNESAKEIATTRHFSKVTLNTGFLAGDENIKNTYSGFYYYNTTLAPKASVSLISTVTPTAEGANKTMKINMTIEMVDYTGYVYSLGYKDPWTNTPAGWFANNYTLTRPEGATYGPRLNVQWSNISKIVMTANFTKPADFGSASFNIIIDAPEKQGFYYDANGWHNGTGYYTCVADKTVDQITTGAMTTVTFSIECDDDSVTDMNLGATYFAYIPKMEFGCIKVYDLNDELLYYLVPHKSGKFYDKVSKTILPMYEHSGSSTPDETIRTYIPNRHLETIDGSFESYDVGTTSISNIYNQSGGTCTVVDTDAFEGSKCLKISGVTDWRHRVYFATSAFSGKNYRFSLMYKSSMPAGTYTGVSSYPNLGVKIELAGGDYNWDGRNGDESYYSSSGEWEWLYVETGTLTSDANIYCFVQLPDDYDVFIDAIYLQEI